MAESELAQTEANALIAMEKHRANNDTCRFPDMGGKAIVPLVSADKRENFFLDISRGRLDLAKGTYQKRGRQIVVLVRLDFAGAPHRNPDGQEIPCPHIHLYREGFADKWAEPVPADGFSEITDAWKTIQDFMRYCNITLQPRIERGIFT